ncbi:hypothetical protein [Feifania hominis]|uniref:Uncharacterized protein n=1 Tax=Feifania hominis TaxID=2763660 RepID=A0A926DFK8_9FIRM|nr:hypothetical protein [Feifania hominis]MBC8537271.1 hypothetical protein [Feifania hominis]
MNEKELLEQIALLLDRQSEQLNDKFSKIDERFEKIDERFAAQESTISRLSDDLSQFKRDVANLFERQMQATIDSETRINIKIENEIGKKIDALFDGYKLNFERHEELKDRVDSLEERVDRLETAV